MNPDPTNLDRLHDVVAPPAVPWWPPAPGWYWVMGIVVFALFALVVRSLLQWQRNRYRREALAEWKRSKILLRDRRSRAVALAAMAELLKRTALSAWPREQVASLTGARWLAFLDRTEATADFSSGLGALMEGVVYDPKSAEALDDSQAQAIANPVQRWINQHRVEGEARC